MEQNPVFLALVAAAAAYLACLWWKDYREAKAGRPHPDALPGACPAGRRVFMIAVAGALVLLFMETAGEYGLELMEQQREITILFGVFTLFAAFMEELIFRGYLVVTGRGRAVLVGSIVLFSLVFALAHPYLWNWDDGLSWDFSSKAWYTTGFLFLNSLWFYTVRFLPSNAGRSLAPCIAAHLTSNAGVFAVKLAQGKVDELW